MIRIEPVKPSNATGNYREGRDDAEVSDEDRNEQASFGIWRQVSDVRRLQLPSARASADDTITQIC